MGESSADNSDKAISSLTLLKMVLNRNDEDSLIIYLSGFNQMFLVYILLNIVVTLVFESDEAGIVKPEDYDFELDSLGKEFGTCCNDDLSGVPLLDSLYIRDVGTCICCRQEEHCPVSVVEHCF